MFFSTLIAAAFLPLFTMTGVSGVIFAPMAYTYAFVIGGAILLAPSLTPALASKLMRIGTHKHEDRLMQSLYKLYAPLTALAIRKPWHVAVASALQYCSP